MYVKIYNCLNLNLNFQNIKYGDSTNTEDVRLRSGTVRRETNLNNDVDMLDINHHHASHHMDNNVLSDCVRIDDASSHSKFKFGIVSNHYARIIPHCRTLLRGISPFIFSGHIIEKHTRNFTKN
jgi:hypothetical protein